jgi:hypothetical protein
MNIDLSDGRTRFFFFTSGGQVGDDPERAFKVLAG